MGYFPHVRNVYFLDEENQRASSIIAKPCQESVSAAQQAIEVLALPLFGLLVV